MVATQKTEKKSIPEVQVVIFRLADEEFGFDISQVKEIIRLQDITPMPKAPDFIEGVINLRGQIVAVMDLAKRLSVGLSTKTDKARIIVTEREDLIVGVVVDEVPEVVRIPQDQIDPTPQIFSTKVHTEFIRGVGKLEGRLIILLDVDKILSKEEVQQVGDVGNVMSHDS